MLMRVLVLAHRWLAITTCVLFAVWFASGVVMMYVDFPALSAPERLTGLKRIDWDEVRIAPDQALQLPDVVEFPQELKLEMMAGEPVYRMRLNGAPPVSVSARTGRTIEKITALQAREIAQEFAGLPKASRVLTVERDQWTVTSTFNVHRPLHRVDFDDAAGTQLYISSHSGEVVLDTTARERTWNWVGAVTHWIYFRDLRALPAVWRQVVLWLSGVGTFVALSGLWLGIDRLRLRKRYRGTSVTPYRGWQAWHHIAGIVGGIFLSTWIFSGWMSMDPPTPWAGEFDMRKVNAGLAAYRGHEPADFATTLPILQQLDDRDVRIATFSWLAGKPQIVLTDGDSRTTVLDAISGAPLMLNEETLKNAAARLVPDATLVDTQLLTQQDAYWYSHRGERKLPALRFKYDDADRTWIYVDPQTGAVLGRASADDRVHRWLFNALHSLDFRWLLAHRPAWDIVMIALSIAGMIVSVSGVVIGWRRVRMKMSG